jgi:hypothetical protein
LFFAAAAGAWKGNTRRRNHLLINPALAAAAVGFAHLLLLLLRLHPVFLMQPQPLLSRPGTIAHYKKTMGKEEGGGGEKIRSAAHGPSKTMRVADARITFKSPFLNPFQTMPCIQVPVLAGDSQSERHSQCATRSVSVSLFRHWAHFPSCYSESCCKVLYINFEPPVTRGGQIRNQATKNNGRKSSFFHLTTTTLKLWAAADSRFIS